MKKYHIITYGCQMNLADSERMAFQLEEVGYKETQDMDAADLIILNTCAVRENAEETTYGKIGELTHNKKRNPDLIIAVTGCMAQKNQAQLFKRAPHIDIVLGTHNIKHLNEMIEEVRHTKEHQLMVDMDNSVLPELEAKPAGTWSAWVPINNGCNKFCTYCIVPHTRGREISRPVEAIVDDVRKLGAKGYKEVTLLGQNVNSYGLDFKDGTDFGTLVKALDHIPGIERIRYMTSHPQDMTKSMIDAMAASSNICHMMHLPLQSGSPEILRRMNRKYTLEHYKDLVAYAREKMPDLVVTTDIIVGFPGESDQDFQLTLDALRDIRYDMVYSFMYSKRSGTPAAEFEDQVDEEVKRVRLQELMDVQNEISLALNKPMEGQVYSIIVEGPSRKNEEVWFGRTEGNKMVLFPKDPSIQPGDLVDARIDKAQTWVLYGTILKD